MDNLNIPAKYQKIWKKCIPYLRKGRPDDFDHAVETVQTILNYQGKIKIDNDILIPVAMMHDVGHSVILEEHFKHITGPKKVINGKLVHMLVGAKIAKDILGSINYNRKKTEEIVDIISMHDADSLAGIDVNSAYNTKNKKIFHDVDRLDRFSENRIKNVSDRYKNKAEIMEILDASLNSFFFNQFRIIALKKLKILKK